MASLYGRLRDTVDTKTHETYRRQRHVDSKHTYINWSKLVRVKRLGVVVAVAETRCTLCGNESVLHKTERRMTKKRGRGYTTNVYRPLGYTY